MKNGKKIFLKNFFRNQPPSASAQGHGLAVDDLDRQCYKNMRCRTCAKLDFGKSCHGLMGYNYHANITEDGQRELSCTDTPLSTNNADCKKALCECDIQLVKDIVSRKDIYSVFWAVLCDFLQKCVFQIFFKISQNALSTT